MNFRMASYCRVSTDKDEQLSSLENQRAFFEQYALKQGDTLVKMYADEGISGKSIAERGAFLRMLEDSETGLFDYVAVKDVSRFARNTSDFLYGIRRLKENGVDVRFISGNQTVIGESEFVLTVFAALAQEESANLSKRVIFGKRQNAKKGRVPNCVYGYDKTGTFSLSVNPEESAVVRLIYKWYIEGEGSRRIAERLNEMGAPTKRGSMWISSTVRRILQNPIYAGKMVNNKTVTKDFLSGERRALPEEEWFVHSRPELRIISDEDFAAAGKILSERRGAVSRHSAKHIFSNLIVCGECGSGFTAKTYRGKTERVRYRCGAHLRGECPNSVSVDENELMTEIKRAFAELAAGDDAFLRRAGETAGDTADSGYLQKALGNIDRRKKRFTELYVNGLIELGELKKEYAALKRAADAVRSELCRAEPYGERGAEQLIMRAELSNADMRALIEKTVVYADKTAEVFLK